MSIELQKPYELIELQYEGDFATITMNNPKRRNALSLKHMLELTEDQSFLQVTILPTWQVRISWRCAKY